MPIYKVTVSGRPVDYEISIYVRADNPMEAKGNGILFARIMDMDIFGAKITVKRVKKTPSRIKVWSGDELEEEFKKKFV